MSLQAVWVKLHPQLCGCVFAGRGDCVVLHYFIRHFVQPPAVDTSASVVTAVWTYVGEMAFNLLVLVGAIKGCDRIVKEIMGL